MRLILMVLALGIVVAANACTSSTAPDGSGRHKTYDDTTHHCSGIILPNGECIP